jgi:hypothetical protein
VPDAQPMSRARTHATNSEPATHSHTTLRTALASALCAQDALGPEDIRAWFREQEQHSWAEFLQPTRQVRGPGEGVWGSSEGTCLAAALNDECPGVLQAPPPKEQQHTESFAQQLKAALAAVVDGVAPPGWIWVECEQPECKQWRLLTGW